MEKAQTNPCWYAVLVERGHERETRAEIAVAAEESSIKIDLSVPLLYIPTKRCAIRRIVLLPGYVFVMVQEIHFLYMIRRSIKHVRGFLSKMGKREEPCGIPLPEMDDFLELVDQRNLDFLRPKFRRIAPREKLEGDAKFIHPDVGTKVRLINDLIGSVVETGESNSAIAIQILGRVTTVFVPRTQPLQLV